MVEINIQAVEGDAQSRCAHYHTELDIIAIRFACCDQFYACYHCHQQLTQHQSQQIPISEFDQPAVWCGKCHTILTVNQYLDGHHSCQNCGAAFNPGCAEHYELYFEMK